MTALDRIFLRRHMAAYIELVNDKRAAENAVARVAIAAGIRKCDVAAFLRWSWDRVYRATTGHCKPQGQLKLADRGIRRAQRDLRMWEGRRAAALERMERYGFIQGGTS